MLPHFRPMSQADLKKRVLAAMNRPENSRCADCHAKDPRWASSTLGVFICLNCSGRHRNLGTHITFVRSCTLDSWTEEQVAVMERIGNETANKYWEARLPPNYQRPATEDLEGLNKFIKQKYEMKKWADPEGQPPHLAGQRHRKKKVRVQAAPPEQNQTIIRSQSDSTIRQPDLFDLPSQPVQKTAATNSSSHDDFLMDILGPPPVVQQPQPQFFQPPPQPVAQVPQSKPAAAPYVQQQGTFDPFNVVSAPNPPPQNNRSALKSLLSNTEAAPVFGNTKVLRDSLGGSSGSVGGFQQPMMAPPPTIAAPVQPVYQPVRGPHAQTRNPNDPFSQISPF